MNIPRIIILLAKVRHPCDATERMHFLTRVPPSVVILSIIEGIQRGKDYLRGGVVFKAIEDFNLRHILDEFNHNQTREFLQGF